MRFIFTLIVLLSTPACIDGPWDDVPGAQVTPISQVEGHADWWQAEVETAVDKWNTALEAQGCDVPFVIVPEGGHPIVLVAEGNWGWDDAHGGMELRNDRIDIRDFPVARGHQGHFWPQAILLHELGHALGLEHVDGYEHVMHQGAVVTDVPEDEVLLAAVSIGCQ